VRRIEAVDFVQNFRRRFRNAAGLAPACEAFRETIKRQRNDPDLAPGRNGFRAERKRIGRCRVCWVPFFTFRGYSTTRVSR
jgi:hypothetical protein